MYELIIKRLIDRYKIYTQIDDFLSWKSRYAGPGTRKERLYDLVKCVRKRDIQQVTLGDLERYRLYVLEKENSITLRTACMREVRCLLRYHRKRGLNCIKPDCIGDLDINYLKYSN